MANASKDPADPKAALEQPYPEEIPGGERALLSVQAEQAKKAMRQALAEAKGHLGKAADPRPYVKKHPWASVGVGAAAGFVAANFLVKGREEKIASRLRVLERAILAEQEQYRKAHGAPSTGGKTAGSRLFRLAWRFARPTLLSAITGALSGAAGGAAASTNEEDSYEGPPPGSPAQPAGTADVT